MLKVQGYEYDFITGRKSHTGNFTYLVPIQCAKMYTGKMTNIYFKKKSVQTFL